MPIGNNTLASGVFVLGSLLSPVACGLPLVRLVLIDDDLGRCSYRLIVLASIYVRPLI